MICIVPCICETHSKALAPPKSQWLHIYQKGKFWGLFWKFLINWSIRNWMGVSSISEELHCTCMAEKARSPYLCVCMSIFVASTFQRGLIIHFTFLRVVSTSWHAVNRLVSAFSLTLSTVTFLVTSASRLCCSSPFTSRDSSRRWEIISNTTLSKSSGASFSYNTFHCATEYYSKYNDIHNNQILMLLL